MMMQQVAKKTSVLSNDAGRTSNHTQDVTCHAVTLLSEILMFILIQGFIYNLFNSTVTVTVQYHMVE